MTPMQLTGALKAASIPGAGDTGVVRKDRLRKVLMAGAIAGTAVLGGCITVKAPDKPIVIELNINIRQEVIYRLAQDADKTITENAEIF